MPRYFFSNEGDPQPPDEAGPFVANPDAARSTAMPAAAEVLKDLRGIWEQPDWKMHVFNEDGSTVCLLTVKNAAHD